MTHYIPNSTDHKTFFVTAAPEILAPDQGSRTARMTLNIATHCPYYARDCLLGGRAATTPQHRCILAGIVLASSGIQNSMRK
jgi:hypothetical protein